MTGPPSEPEPLLSQVWYCYNCGGNVTRVVRNEAGSSVFTATRMEYARNGRTVTFVLGESWEWDGQVSCPAPASYAVSYAREFRYDGARQRYLNRPLDPATLAPITDFGAAVWTDYDGDSPYGDYVVGGLDSAVEWRSYEPGIGEVGPWTLSGDANTQYHHADHLGTLRLMSDEGGAGDGHRVWTAFGERLAGPATPDRYGYVGAHGYQAHEEFPFLDIGGRFYDPESGRVLQRGVSGYQDRSLVDEIVGRSKGGKKNIKPSDLPNNWDKMPTKEQQDYINEKIKDANSPEHKKVWEGFKKTWKRNKVQESSRPPLIPRFFSRIPAPDQPTANRWGRNAAIVAGGALCGAAVIATGGGALPVLIPAL